MGEVNTPKNWSAEQAEFVLDVYRQHPTLQNLRGDRLSR